MFTKEIANARLSRQASEKLSTAEERVVVGESDGTCTMDVMSYGQAPLQYSF